MFNKITFYLLRRAVPFRTVPALFLIQNDRAMNIKYGM